MDDTLNSSSEEAQEAQSSEEHFKKMVDGASISTSTSSVRSSGGRPKTLRERNTSGTSEDETRPPDRSDGGWGIGDEARMGLE